MRRLEYLRKAVAKLFFGHVNVAVMAELEEFVMESIHGGDWTSFTITR